MSFDAHSFAHRRLTAYTSALEMARQAKLIADGIPRGYRTFADQLLRAAGATVLLVAEGANRRSGGSKRQRFEEAMGRPDRRADQRPGPATPVAGATK